MMTFSAAAELTGGTLHGMDGVFSGVRIDSRAVQRGELFVAIRGDRLDGHDFVADAADRGAAGALVARRTDAEISQVAVADTTVALGRLAFNWRRAFDIPVIGITGSNGKTTVTAMVREILSVSGHPLAPRESFNNQWGVPLTLLELAGGHTHAVIEMGMNHAGEIDRLTRIAAPTVALVNNAVAAHLEGLGSVERVAEAKGEIFNGLGPDGVAVLNRDDPNFGLWQALAGERRILTFGLKNEADFRGRDVEFTPAGSRLSVSSPAGDAEITLGVPGRHNVMNALAAMAACHAVGTDLGDLSAGLAAFTGIPGRLRRLSAAGGAALVDDSFNANPGSVAAAIDFLSSQPGRRILVLGAMAELGHSAEEHHAAMGSYARRGGIDRLLVLNDGDNPDLAGYRRGYGGCTEVFPDVPSLVASLAAEDSPGNIILVKGSKSSRMGRVVQALAAGGEPGDASC